MPQQMVGNSLSSGLWTLSGKLKFVLTIMVINNLFRNLCFMGKQVVS